jgi:ATP-dependent protease ClpP protease subunit
MPKVKGFVLINKNKTKKLQHSITDRRKKSDDDDEESILPFFDDDKIYRQNNHIYYRDDVTTESISKLIKLIDEANDEFQDLEMKTKNVTITPDPLYIHITSHGGSLLAGFMGADAIENSKIPVHTIVDGYAMSAATFLSLAGEFKYMTRNSYMLIHQLSSQLWGTFDQTVNDHENNVELMNRIKQLYEEKTEGKLKGKSLDNILKHDRYWNFDTCFKYGLVDEVYEPNKKR